MSNWSFSQSVFLTGKVHIVLLENSIHGNNCHAFVSHGDVENEKKGGEERWKRNIWKG